MKANETPTTDGLAGKFTCVGEHGTEHQRRPEIAVPGRGVRPPPNPRVWPPKGGKDG